jgi:hypothetical protein
MTNINNVSNKRLFENEEDYDYCDPETEDCEEYEDVSDEEIDTDEASIFQKAGQAVATTAQGVKKGLQGFATGVAGQVGPGAKKVAQKLQQGFQNVLTKVQKQNPTSSEPESRERSGSKVMQQPGQGATRQ